MGTHGYPTHISPGRREGPGKGEIPTRALIVSRAFSTLRATGVRSAEGDGDAAACVAEVVGLVGLATVAAAEHPGFGVLGLAAVAQPVGAGGRAWFGAQGLDEAGGVLAPGRVVGGGVEGVGQALGQVLGEVAEALAGGGMPASASREKRQVAGLIDSRQDSGFRRCRKASSVVFSTAGPWSGAGHI